MSSPTTPQRWVGHQSAFMERLGKAQREERTGLRGSIRALVENQPQPPPEGQGPREPTGAHGSPWEAPSSWSEARLWPSPPLRARPRRTECKEAGAGGGLSRRTWMAQPQPCSLRGVPSALLQLPPASFRLAHSSRAPTRARRTVRLSLLLLLRESNFGR